MIRSQRFWIAAAAVIFAVSLVLSIVLLNIRRGNTVTIKQDGRTLYTLDLSREPDRTFDITYEGRTNTVEIKDGRIRMLEADCPDRVCVNTGWLSAGIPIVCLPNKLVIEYSGDDSAPDAVAG